MASFSTRERIDGLRALGYTEREAGFLVPAALHSGYFLRRQYYAFAQVDTGKSAFLLEKKLLDNKHASVTTYPFGTQLHHLRSHPFYKAIGEGENRHRRPRSPLAVKVKLMGLDFVLARPQHTFLATESERTSFFINSYGLDEGVLPGKTYRVKHGGPTERRYFIEKYPLFVASDPSSRRHLASFCYVDEGVISTAGFGSFLKRYARLFVELGNFRLCRVGGGALTRWPPSAAQTARAVFPHAAFTKTQYFRDASEGINPTRFTSPYSPYNLVSGNCRQPPLRQRRHRCERMRRTIQPSSRWKSFRTWARL